MPLIRAAGPLLLAACALPGLQASSAEHLTLQRLEDPLAVCSDGSRAGYYWGRASTEKGSRLWILYLEGGGWCYNAESCGRRCPSGGTSPLCSSRNWAPQLALGEYPCGLASPNKLCGIFAPPSGSHLRDANKVYVRYCSSDAFMGNASAFGMEFRGANIVAAVLRDLARRRALGLAGHGLQDTLLFGGGSAGARGALLHLDYVKSMLGESVASGLVVKGFLDSPLWIDAEPFQQKGGPTHPAEFSFHEQTEMVFGYANVRHLGEDCERKHRVESAWKCIFAQYRLPHVQTPYLLVASQYDTFQLSAYVGHKPKAPAEARYAERLAHTTVGVLWELVSPERMIFSWACWGHMLSMEDRFSQDLCRQEVTMLDATEQFIGLVPTTGDFYWIDTCEGVDCGQCSGPRRTTSTTANRGSSTLTLTSRTSMPSATATPTAPATSTLTASGTSTTSGTTPGTTVSGTDTDMPTMATTATAAATTVSTMTTTATTTSTSTTRAAPEVVVVADSQEPELAPPPGDDQNQPPVAAAPGGPEAAGGDEGFSAELAAARRAERKAALAVRKGAQAAQQTPPPQRENLMLTGTLACLMLLPGAWLIVYCGLPVQRRRGVQPSIDAYSPLQQELAGASREQRGGSIGGRLARLRGEMRTASVQSQPEGRGDSMDFDETVRRMEETRPKMLVPRLPIAARPTGLPDLWSLFAGDQHYSVVGSAEQDVPYVGQITETQTARGRWGSWGH